MLDRFIKKSGVKWLLVFGCWTLIGLAFASQLYITRGKIGLPVTWNFALGSALADWYVFALLSIPAVWLSHRFRLERAHWRRSLAIHLSASAVFAVGWVILRVWIEQWQNRASDRSFSFPDTFSASLFKTAYFNVLVYWAVVSVSHAFGYYREYQEREFRAADLEKRLAQARLQALQMQLNPHFLFNTLNAIASLMHKDVEAADRMIARLSELLRYALESTDDQEVPLEQELDFLGRYLDIQQTRFGDRLQVGREIAADTLDALVPNLILQPLVENAICHGIAPHAAPGRIMLRAQRSEGWLQLEVRDNGKGLPDNGTPDEGVGLSNTRARLEQLYPQRFRFTFNRAPEGGLAVQIEIPFRTPSKDVDGSPRESG